VNLNATAAELPNCLGNTSHVEPDYSILTIRSENRVNARLKSQMGPRLEPQLHVSVPAAVRTPVRGSRRKNFMLKFSGQEREWHVAIESYDAPVEVMGEVNRKQARRLLYCRFGKQERPE
jgi:hypothetical protein